jgi:hypothetical protein
MALYREGKAAMAADGTVTGTGTKWQSSLSLIRPGATIMFLSSPIQMAVVNKVVSDTEIKAITTNGAVVASTDYAILLSDSLTVDGLAQDVAETLRHYQSQETVIADAVEFFKNFDFDSLQGLANQIKQDSESAGASATAAAASEGAAKTSETNAKASENAAKTSEFAAETARDQVQQIINDAGEQSTLVALAQPTGAGKSGLLHGGTVQNLQTFLSFDMFNIDKTGATDVTAQILSVFKKSRDNKIPIEQHDGVYLVSGNASFYSYIDECDLKLSGCTFLLAANFTGRIYATTRGGMITYDSESPVVGKINAAAATDLLAGSSTLDSLGDDTTLNDCFVIINFSDDLYCYNNTNTADGVSIRKYCHVTRISANGRMDNALPYDATSVVSIKAIKIINRRGIVEFPNIDYRNDPYPIALQAFYLTNTFVYGGKILNKPIKSVGNRHVIDMQYGGYRCIVKGVYDPYPSSTFTDPTYTKKTASYTFHHAWTCGLHVEDIDALGYGWGAISAAGYITDTTFERCSANNFDSHDPIIGHYRLIDCTVGDSGVVNIGVVGSTVECHRVTFELGRGNADPYTGKIFFPSLFQTRTTSGAVSDSKLIVRDCVVNGKWKNYNSSTDGRAGIVQASADKYTDLPSGSPMDKSPFCEIDIDGLTINDPETAKVLINPVFSTRDATVYHPLYTKMHNVSYAGEEGMIKFNLVNFLPRPSNTSTTKDPNVEPVSLVVDMDNIDVRNITFQRPEYGYQHNMLVRIGSLKRRRYQAAPTKLRISQRGVYNLYDPNIEQIITNDGTSESGHRVEVNLYGGSVKSGENLPIVTANTSFLHRFSAKGTDFVGDYSSSNVTESNKSLAQWCKLDGCSFFDYTNGAFVSNLLIWSGSVTGELKPVELYVAKGNNITTVQTQSDISYFDTFKLSYHGSGRLCRAVSTGGTASAENTRTGTVSINVNGTEYSGACSTQMNMFSSYLQVGTRDSQAYIAGIYSQLTMISLSVS